MIKLIIISVIVASASSAVLPLRKAYPTPVVTKPYQPVPYSQPSGRQYAILRLESEIASDGSSYHYGYDTENGISADQSGNLIGSGKDVALDARGGFQYTSPEGVPVQISYVADENGYHATGNVLPTSPPIPDAIARSLAYIAAHPQPQTVQPNRPYYKK